MTFLSDNCKKESNDFYNNIKDKTTFISVYIYKSYYKLSIQINNINLTDDIQNKLNSIILTNKYNIEITKEIVLIQLSDTVSDNIKIDDTIKEKLYDILADCKILLDVNPIGIVYESFSKKLECYQGDYDQIYNELKNPNFIYK